MDLIKLDSETQWQTMVEIMKEMSTFSLVNKKSPDPTHSSWTFQVYQVFDHLTTCHASSPKAMLCHLSEAVCGTNCFLRNSSPQGKTSEVFSSFKMTASFLKVMHAN